MNDCGAEHNRPCWSSAAASAVEDLPRKICWRVVSVLVLAAWEPGESWDFLVANKSHDVVVVARRLHARRMIMMTHKSSL